MRLLVLFALSVLASANAQEPNAEDLLWRKSVEKFDTQRQALLQTVDRVAKTGPFQPNWNSLSKYEVPSWYQDAKFGIFLHWGLYSVPAFGSEWYPRTMYRAGRPEYEHEVATHGPLNKFGYKDFVRSFRAERFNAEQWADLFQRSGAKYVIPVAEHHDGFAMYDSDLSDWCAAKMGPKRDIVGELEKAVRAAGLHFGASSHRAEHYWFLNNGRDLDSDVNDTRYAAFYGPAHRGPTDSNKYEGHPDSAYLDDWLARTTEIVTKYHPEIMWFDWWIEKKEFEPYLQRFAAFYYNDAKQRGGTASINYKNKTFPDSAAVLDIERGQLDAARPNFWQTDTSISVKSWGYIEGDTFRSPESLIAQLVDIVSKNGALLLNVGPKPDGTIPDEAQRILVSMGTWLKTNGEAIYGTRPWRLSGEGPTRVVAGSFNDTATKPYSSEDIRFTAKGEAIYAIVMAPPSTTEITIKSFTSQEKVHDIQLLGSSAKLKWTRQADGLKIELPAARTDKFPFTFRIS